MTTASMIAIALGSALTAQIERQDIVVDVAGDVLHVEIDAVFSAGGEFPIYALAADAVATLDGAPVALEDDTGEYAGLVQWLSVPDEGGTVRVVVDGDPDCSSKVQPGADSCTFRLGSANGDDEIVLLPTEPGAAWYLINLYGPDAFTGSVTVRAPSSLFVAAGQGAPVAVAEDAAARVTTSTFAFNVETELLAVIARAMDTVDVDGVQAGVPTTARSEDPRAVMERVANTAARVRPLYEDMFGALPFDELHFLPVSGRFPFGGLGLLGNVLIGDFITWPKFDYLVEQGTAHELAHSWWGGLTSAVNVNEGGFLQEAFAEYSAWRALGHDDDNIRTAGARMNAVWYVTQTRHDFDIAILDASAPGADPNAYILVTYHKGSVVLRALENVVGEEAFTTALAALVARGPGELSIAALEEELENASGVDVGADLAQWLEQPGFPTLTANVDRAVDGTATLALNVSSGFDVDVPARITFANGDVEVVLVPGNTELTLAAGAVRVELDPRWTLPRLVQPALDGDVSCDGRVDALDMIEVALRRGGAIPDARRVDGSYDPLFDIDNDGSIDAQDVDAVLVEAR